MADLAPDVVIVGGGIAGGVLATVLARNGLEVFVLERETTYPDRVRGEYMPPWGVVEFKRLGLLDVLYENGGLHIERNIPYDENWSPEVAEERALDVSKLLPDVAGALCIGHPTMCNAFCVGEGGRSESPKWYQRYRSHGRQSTDRIICIRWITDPTQAAPCHWRRRPQLHREKAARLLRSRG